MLENGEYKERTIKSIQKSSMRVYNYKLHDENIFNAIDSHIYRLSEIKSYMARKTNGKMLRGSPKQCWTDQKSELMWFHSRNGNKNQQRR